jgi:hypothetical protein
LINGGKAQLLGRQHWPGYLPPWSVVLIACLGERTNQRWLVLWYGVTTGTKRWKA